MERLVKTHQPLRVSRLRVANRLWRLCPLGTRFPTVPAGVIGRREGARIQWMQLPKAASD